MKSVELEGVFKAVLQAPRHCLSGVLMMVLVFLLLSVLATLSFDSRSRVFVAGEIATCDVTARRSMLVEDTQATQARREQILQLQPPVYDLSTAPYAQFHAHLMGVFQELNAAPNFSSREDGDVARLIDTLTPDVADDVIVQISLPAVQGYIQHELLPLIRERMYAGLVGDVRTSHIGRTGAIIRDLETGNETLHTETTLPDLPSFFAEISTRLLAEQRLSPAARKAVMLVISALLPPSLTLNQEMTRLRSQDAADQVAPIYHQLQQGEVVVRKGAKVSREQQIKLQALYNAEGENVRWHSILGALCLALLLSLGFFITPSGKAGTPLRCKDILLLSMILLIFGASAKLVQLPLERIGDLPLISSLAYMFPAGGAVALVPMVFAARRYCTMGLLLAFFCTLMFRGDVPLFLFYFLGGMLATLLVSRARSRRDVVLGIFPLMAGQLLLGLGAGLLGQTPPDQLPMLLGAVVINSIVSLLMLFALSSVLEIILGYTTRFRLMELMNLEQPLMQEIMVTMPGTYHHSLVVANMVEAGASAIGANGLLCKVAALYHDAGKLSHPEYFIENQFGGPNKHDKLAPSMSALILTSHVKKGTELAQQHGLGQEIIDIIRQHHGTRVIRYFYQKAVNAGEHPRETDYCYPGPRPQTKEAAILMLADSVEASSRTLSDPTPARLKSHIDTIIKGIFSEGQLDETELTFRDLHKISETFLRILTGIFHQRIAYPPERSIRYPEPGNGGGTVAPAAPPKASPGTAADGSLLKRSPEADGGTARNAADTAETCAPEALVPKTADSPEEGGKRAGTALSEAASPEQDAASSFPLPEAPLSGDRKGDR